MKRPRKHSKNIILLSLVFLSLQAVASGFETGDEVSVEALGKAYFIQGEAPDKWEAGKLYVTQNSSVCGARQVGCMSSSLQAA